MTEYKTDNKLGVGEILICNRDTNGKLESLKSFIGKVIINVCGGGENIYVIEEKDKILSEVKSIQSRSNFKELMNTNVSGMKHRTNKSHSIHEMKISENEEADLGKTRKRTGNSFHVNKENEQVNANLHNINELDEIKENMEDFNIEKEKEELLSMSNKQKYSENNEKERGPVINFGPQVLKNSLNKEPVDDNEIFMNIKENGSTSPILNTRLSNINLNRSDKPDSNININSNAEEKINSKNSFSNIKIDGLKDQANENYDDAYLISNKEALENSNSPLARVKNEDFKDLKDINSEISGHTNYSNDFIGSNTKNTITFPEKESQIIQIVRGKYHLLKLTMDGKVYGSGESYFGVVGLGGALSSEKPILIPNLAKLKIVQVACGMYHSLALSNSGDLYAWGMGFEGQLGLTAKYKVASSPRYVNFFYKKPVKFICCGHNFSLCTTNDSRLWGWGENKLGQLGLGKIQVVDKPTHIELFDLPGNQEGCTKADSSMSSVYERPYTSKPLSACYISAGYAHTAIVTDEGFLLTCGLNIYGQLGLGHTTSTFEPKLIEKDNNGDFIGKVVKAGCNISGTFIITEEGRLYTCGSGDIGHGESGMIKLPRLISDSRVYKHILCNDNSVVAFCPLRIISISPTCGPATGNTILSIIGSALKEFPKLSVRFIFGGVARDVKATFDKLSRTIFVRTPNFLELSPSLELPAICNVQLTFDGHYFTEYQDTFLIYSSNIKLVAIEPKCGPTIGGSQLQIKVSLDGISSKYMFSLTCGFQAKPIASEISLSKKHKTKRNRDNSNTMRNSEISEDSKLSNDDNINKSILATNLNPPNNTTAGASITSINNNFNINPMDFANIESQLDKANWYCCFATYENNMMTCKIPKIENFNQSQVEYNVDVAINGQQFTGYPMIYRFYDIKVEKMEPNISSLEGGLMMKILGTGLFDSITKKAKITSVLGERFSDLQWDRNDKALILNSNPIHWITYDEDVVKHITPSELYENYSFDVHVTMNNIEWIYAGAYRYCDPKVSRVVYHIFPENVNKDDRLIYLSTQEFLSNDEKTVLGLVAYPDDKKKKEEIEKKKNEEDTIINTVVKRPYNGLVIYGNFFPNTHLLKVKFVSQHFEIQAIAFFKNKYKITCLIPEMHKLPVGQNELKIMVSVNSQKFFSANKVILYNSPEYGLKFEDIVKLDEADAKGGKKKK